MEELDEFLAQRARQGLLRELLPISRRRKGKVYLAGKKYIDFCSNDYLGLSHHPQLIKISQQALTRFGTSSSASRLLSGDIELFHVLEEKIAAFKGKQSALVFNSGYQANIGIISALYGKDDCIFSDFFNHASIQDGLILSGARFFRFQHNDLNHLKYLLKKERDKFKKALIVTESIFSMDGDKASLKELVELKEKYNCWLMVDEAHATGIFGDNGSGLVKEEGMTEQTDLIMGTFSKALGSFGAYLACSKKIADYLVNTCRSFIYSTALPPSVIACNIESIELVQREPERRKQLLSCAHFFRESLKEKGIPVRSCSQIVPLIIGDNLRTIEFASKLRERGYWVLPIRPPTVPRGESRLRFSLTVYHTKEILEKLVNDIIDVILQIGP